MKTIAVVLGLCVSLPIWYYLLYQILVRVQATELMLFLFWVYLPVNILVSVITKLIDRS